MAKFVHVADLHLDAPLQGLERYDRHYDFRVVKRG